MCVRALKGLALPRMSHFSEIAVAGPRRLRSTLAAALVLFADTVVTVHEHKGFLLIFIYWQAKLARV